VNPVVEAACAALARIRSARAFHPRGALFAGRMELDGPGSPTVTVLGATTQPALVRVSKGAGTPGHPADLLGLAVRLPGGPVDLLHTTVGRHRCTGALLAPATGWCSRPYSTLLPYRADGERVTLGLWPRQPERARGAEPRVARAAVRQEPLVFDVMEKRARMPWAPIGRLLLDLPMPDGAEDDGPDGTDPVTFDPVVHAHPRLRPVRALAAVRAAANAGSRRGRDAPDVRPRRKDVSRPPWRAGRGPGSTWVSAAVDAQADVATGDRHQLDPQVGQLGGAPGRQPGPIVVDGDGDRRGLDRPDPQVALDAVARVDLDGLRASEVQVECRVLSRRPTRTAVLACVRAGRPTPPGPPWFPEVPGRVGGAVPGGDVAGCGISSQRTHGSLAPRLRGRQVRPSTVIT
jgi:hypothetical protein